MLSWCFPLGPHCGGVEEVGQLSEAALSVVNGVFSQGRFDC